MNVLLALSNTQIIALGAAIGGLVLCVIFAIVFACCILPAVRRKKAAKKQTEVVAEKAEVENTVSAEAAESNSEAEQGEINCSSESAPEDKTEPESATQTVDEAEPSEEIAEAEICGQTEENATEPAELSATEEVKPAESVKTEAAAVCVAIEDDEDEAEDDVEDNETDEAREERLAAIGSAHILEDNQRYNRSFKARLIQSSDTVKDWYASLKDAALTYKGTRSSLSWRQEKIYKGKTLLLKTVLRGKTLCIYLPVQVNEIVNIEVEDVSDKTVHAATPALFRIKNEVNAKQALELIAIAAEKLQLESGKPYKTDRKEYALQTTEQLYESGLVKIVTAKN